MAFKITKPSTWFKRKDPTPTPTPSIQYSAPIGPARPADSGGTGVLPSTPTAPTPAPRISGGGSSSSSGSYQGPVPQGATPAQEQEFRQTGSISTPVTPTQSTSATQVSETKATNLPSSYLDRQTLPLPDKNLVQNTNYDLMGGTKQNNVINPFSDFTAPTKSSTFGTKAQDMFVAGLGGLGLGGGMKMASSEELPFITSGDTRDFKVEDYQRKQKDIENDFWKKGGIFNPVNVVTTAKEYYDLRQDVRTEQAKLKDSLSTAYYTKFTPESQFTTLAGGGFVPSDIKYKRDVVKDVKTEILGDQTITTTTTSVSTGLTTPDFTFGTARGARAGYLADKGFSKQAYVELGLGSTWNVGEFGLKALALKKLGITGGPSTEGGLVGQGLTSFIGNFPKVGRIAEFGMKPAVLLTGVVIKGGADAYGGYKFGKEVGLNPFVTATISGSEGVGKIYAFTAGATGGEISPIKLNQIKLVDITGKTKTLSTLSIGEPFSRKYTALGSRFNGKTSFGYMSGKKLAGFNVVDSPINQMAFGTAEGEALIKYYGRGAPEYKVVTQTVGNLRLANLKETPNVDLTQQKTFSGMTKAQQMQWTKEMQTLGSGSSTTGFRSFTGSITGTYGRPAGDVDVVLGARANAGSIAKGIAGRMGSGFTSNTKGQIFFKGTKVFEGLTPENAIPQPMGYFGRFPQGATIGGVGTASSTTTTTRAGQSLTELGSAIRYPAGFSSTGQLTFGADKTQRIADFAFTAEKLASASGKPFDSATFKNVYTAKYGNIDWRAGQLIQPAGFASVGGSSSSVTSTVVAVFMPEGASSTSANIKAFIPTRTSTSSRSMSSFAPSIPSRGSSFSSKSSISSLSSMSSRSSPSSISSFSSMSSPSSFSSASSLSSMSSRSSRSSSSSSSSSITGFAVTPFPFTLPKFFGADAGGGLGKIKAKRTYRYTPSIGALVRGTPFKVGALSTKKFTGLEFRGSTPKTTKKKSRKSKK
jgi:hypothetical protein